ncbi:MULTISPECIES: SirB2 family protein [unclassified Caballeronia]|uniref:SirB2 family protein n=1 Tax=unclassified Caballeronia TaxID=2646786 RepID=UPI002859E553|nr:MULTISPECIES: SirB2 family protein [unclassified Caballeronia]MDR5750884.1 SirB2 family protein [Caballeronia sp. LZ024]MDR5842084.1 SirB2 family protein [Caballeronia sp. LZ031]
MSDYFLPLRAVHMTFAALSIASFFVRWLWMLLDSPLLHKRATRIAPHVIDTALLLSALALVAIIGFGANAAWLSAKIAGLVVYIVLGTFALKRGRTKAVRAFTGVLAIATFAFIASVARSHDPLGFLRML